MVMLFLRCPSTSPERVVKWSNFHVGVQCEIVLLHLSLRNFTRFRADILIPNRLEMSLFVTESANFSLFIIFLNESLVQVTQIRNYAKVHYNFKPEISSQIM